MVRKRGVGVHSRHIRRMTSSHFTAICSTRVARGVARRPVRSAASVRPARRGRVADPRPRCEPPGARNANLAGARCASGVPCPCRDRPGTRGERRRPTRSTSGSRCACRRRGGGATLDSPTLGHFAAGADEACFYIDVLPGTTSEVTSPRREAQRESGHRARAGHRRVRTQGAMVVRHPGLALRGTGRTLQPRRRGRLGRGGKDPQARPHRSLRVDGHLAASLGHLGRHRRSRARVVPRLHREVLDRGQTVRRPSSRPARPNACPSRRRKSRR